MALLRIEPFGGMAGDMFLAALCDLEQEAFGLGHLEELVEALLPGACELSLEETLRGSLRARHLRVRTDETGEHVHRSLSDLVRILDASPLSAAARRRSARILERLAVVEAGLHGTTVDEVHFHELGAVDTLVDVCGAVFALERLSVERVVASAPYVGSGTVRCAHGELPVPAPATAALLAGIPQRVGPGGERVTPTGAVLLAELVSAFEPTEILRPVALGYGAGSAEPAQGPPNLLRVALCEELRGAPARAEAWLLECNLDDATGEEIGFLLSELRRAGALEAWSAPVQMKKDRPGAVISALCRGPDREALEQLVFRHSPTLGVRWSSHERTECAREELVVELEGRSVRVKVRRRGGPLLPVDLSPEYDDLADLARATGRPLRELEREARERALAQA